MMPRLTRTGLAVVLLALAACSDTASGSARAARRSGSASGRTRSIPSSTISSSLIAPCV